MKRAECDTLGSSSTAADITRIFALYLSLFFFGDRQGSSYISKNAYRASNIGEKLTLHLFKGYAMPE